MSIRNLIILSQLNPPAQRTRVLYRDRIKKELSKSINYPLTILDAGTGYGKSTALISFLRDLSTPIFWFTISGTDRDPIMFLAKLFSAFNQGHQDMGEEALRILEMPEATSKEAMVAFVNALSLSLEEDAIFIIDDFHRVADIPDIMAFVNWFIENLPRKLHLIFATRQSLKFSDMNKWQVRGQILQIDRETLAFSRQEISDLFKQTYNITLSPEDVDILHGKSEGWAIALQLIGQTIERNPQLSINEVLEDDRLSKTALFEYLADEVFNGLSNAFQAFLLKTSILSKLDSTTCDFLLTIDNSNQVLKDLHNSGFFIEELRPGVFRYHQLFREFLLNRLQKDDELKNELHLKIASYYRAHEYWEEAIYHLLAAGDFQQIQQILMSIGEKVIKEGRYESVNYWISAIPREISKAFPHLNFLLGEINRYLGNFEDALEYYHIAERLYRKNNNKPGTSKALRGQAQVFLDTIRPINADQLLQDALQQIESQEMLQDEIAGLLVLTAENQLNLGFPESAEQLLARAKKIRSDFDTDIDLIQARILLRTGRLQEGINLLVEREADHPSINLQRPQRFHRESALLLSLFYSVIGEADRAQHFALQGIELGDNLKSTFVQSVGYMRLGHALLLKYQNPFSDYGFNLAMDHHREAINKVDVIRIHVEPLWGMCQALGYIGDIQGAIKLAEESLSIAEKAGDVWISVLINLSVGSGAVLAEQFDLAQQYLTDAETSAIRVKDPFTLAVARLWLSMKAWKQGYENTAFGYLEKAIKLIQENDYSFLLTKKSLMGLRDEEEIIPLLIAAKTQGIQHDYIEKILEKKNFKHLSYHPGYSLWVRTLGSFKIWRGYTPIDRGDWKREKALQLFQFLIGQRDRWVSRDQIISVLWPESSFDEVSNYLKVVFSTLNDVLEPNRPKGESPFFVVRNQERYRLNPNAKVNVDADLFLQYCKDDNPDNWLAGLNLYQGQYFSDSDIQEWLMIEKQYYHQQYLLASDKLVEHLINHEDYERALQVTFNVLSQDNLWESAYRAQMLIYNRMERFGMVQEIFKQAQDIFRTQIQSDVSQKTKELFKQLTDPVEKQ
jgi:DNA-binding SARP family transcriptional activator